MDQNELLQKIFSLISEYVKTGAAQPFLDYKSPKELSHILQLEKDATGNFNTLLGWVEQYLAYGIRSNNPGFVNRMWAGANLPSMIGELITAVSNTSACTYESAPVSTLMENYMLSEMLALVGYSSGEGQMTTGSSNANMIAMMSARNQCLEHIKTKGYSKSPRLVAFVNGNAHYSMDKAANILAIGTDNLIKVDYNENGEMLTDDLAEKLQQSLEESAIPFFVAATAGTTVRGAYDAIEPLIALKEKYGFWLHVDGAWGGAAIMSDSLRKRYLSGIEKSDSFTCDFHKMLGSSLMCNFLLINRSQQTLQKVLAGGDGSYLFRNCEEDDDVYDLGTKSLQCGRRVDALKWFLDWKYFGREGFAIRIENYLKLIQYAEQIVKETRELELVSPRVSFNLCFRYLPKQGDINAFNHRLRTNLYTKGKALVGLAYIHETLTMRLLICNQTVDHTEVRRFFDNLLYEAKRLEQKSGN